MREFLVEVDIESGVLPRALNQPDIVTALAYFYQDHLSETRQYLQVLINNINRLKEFSPENYIRYEIFLTTTIFDPISPMDLPKTFSNRLEKMLEFMSKAEVKINKTTLCFLEKMKYLSKINEYFFEFPLTQKNIDFLSHSINTKNSAYFMPTSDFKDGVLLFLRDYITQYNEGSKNHPLNRIFLNPYGKEVMDSYARELYNSLDIVERKEFERALLHRIVEVNTQFNTKEITSHSLELSTILHRTIDLLID